jgi:hypothetical protein
MIPTILTWKNWSRQWSDTPAENIAEGLVDLGVDIINVKQIKYFEDLRTQQIL